MKYTTLALPSSISSAGSNDHLYELNKWYNVNLVEGDTYYRSIELLGTDVSMCLSLMRVQPPLSYPTFSSLMANAPNLVH